MVGNVIAIPLPPDEPVRETTGQRGTPEMDFDFLNAIQAQTRSRLGTLQQRAQGEREDLSTILQDVNVAVKETRKSKRDSDLMFKSQADELAARSDQISQQAMKAAADPFNEIKALFGSTLSMADWAAQHNTIQNELSTVKRRYTSSTAGYNFNLDQAAGEIQFAQQKLALTKESIAGITATSQAITTQIGAQSAMFTQQMDTMLEPDLRAELKDPQGSIPKFLVQRRLILIEKAKAELATVKAKKGKSLAEVKRIEFDIITKYPELLSEATVARALVSEQPVVEPNTGILITPQIAKTIGPKQAEKAQLDAKLLSELTQNTLQGQQAFTQVVGVLNRTAGPGVSVLGRDAQGNATGFNPDALPADMRQDAATMFDLQNQARNLAFTLSDPNFTGELREQTRLVENELNRRATELRNEIVKKAREDAKLLVVGKQAKESAANFAEFGTVKSDPGSQQLLAEGAAGVIPGAESILSTAHGAGWGDGMVVFGSEFNDQWQSMIDTSPELFGDEDGELDSKQLLNAMLAGNVKAADAGILATQKALGQVDVNGNNRVQSAILSDWYEIALNRGIRELEERHGAEPGTVAMLQTLRLGTIALDPAVTTLQDQEGTTLDTANVLFSMLALKERALRESGTLPEDSTLVHELQSLMLGDTVGDPARNESIYDLAEIRALTVSTTKESASLNWKLFRNRANATFRAGLQNIVRNVPLGTVDVARELSTKERKVKTAEFTRLPPAERNQMAQDLIELRKQEQGETSTLTNVMRQLLQRQEQQ